RTLGDTEIRFRGTFDQAAVGMALAAPDGRWLRVNRRFCDMLGYTEADLLSRTFRDVTHPDDIEGDAEGVRQLLAGEAQSFNRRKRYLHRDGAPIWGDLTV